MMSTENAENYTDGAPCVQKTAILSDDDIIAAAKRELFRKVATVTCSLRCLTPELRQQLVKPNYFK